MIAFAKKILFLISGAIILNSCSQKESVIRLINNSEAEIADVIEYNQPDAALLELLSSDEYSLWDGNEAIPFEIVENSINKKPSLLLLANMKPKSTRNLQVRKQDGNPRPSFKKLTQAELWVKEGGKFVGRKYEGGSFVRIDSLPVPEGFTDHAYYIKYEGPGWESDKVGFRFYLDWRNAVDVFGKKVNDLVLKDVGQDGWDSYHEPADWGMDILKVGNTLGLGTIAYWTGDHARRVDSTESVACRISKDGILRSEIVTFYKGWDTGTGKYDMNSYISIDGGSRMTKQVLTFDGACPDNICTGIIKDKNAIYFEKESNGSWACMATWGKQSLADDSLGLAVFYNKSFLVRKTEDNLNHVAILKPVENYVEYYYAPAWEKEPNGIKTRAAFENYIDWQLERLNRPVEAKLQ